MSEIAIRMQEVTKTYIVGKEEVRALRGLTFNIHYGEFVSIMGPSGSGKSTCMNMIGCLDKATSGIVAIAGQDTLKLKDKELARLRNETIGFVFQQYHLLPSMNVLENVMLPLRYKRVARYKRAALAKSVLESVGMEDRLKHRPNELSGGQKQRVAIARALVTSPSIILADEPTGALDSKTGAQVLALFRLINKRGVTVVLVTHDKSIGESADRCIKIFDGKIKEDYKIKH